MFVQWQKSIAAMGLSIIMLTSQVTVASGVQGRLIPGVQQCHSSVARHHPRSLVLTCGSMYPRLENLYWSDWTNVYANGVGTYVYKQHGGWHEVPAMIRLSKVKKNRFTKADVWALPRDQKKPQRVYHGSLPQ